MLRVGSGDVDGVTSFEEFECGGNRGGVVCSGKCFSSLRLYIIDGRELCSLIACQHAGMNSSDVARTHDADSDLSHLCLRNNSLGGRVGVTRELEWVLFPVFWPEDFDTRDFVVPDLSERRDH